jgi:hypothetical protein
MAIKTLGTLFFISILLLSCHDTGVPPNVYWGQCTVDINGVQEILEPYCFSYDNKFKLHFDGYHETEFLRYKLTFGNLEKRIYSIDSIESFTGNNQIEYATFYTLLLDGDVFGNSYKVIENYQNYFEINQFDEIKNEFTGKFTIAFVVDSLDKNEQSTPDTILISNGEFKAKL